jgi:hypothetical protein
MLPDLRTSTALITAAVLVLAATPSATAAVDASVGDGTLVLRSSGTDLNVVDVHFDGVDYLVYNATSPLTVGTSCLPTDLGTVRCVGPIGAAVVHGAEGDDLIDLAGVPVPLTGDGGPGDDALGSGTAVANLTGGEGEDALGGGLGDDRLEGGDGDDLLEGKSGSDTQTGGGGDDILEAHAGDDFMDGGAGADLLDGAEGEDSLDGGPGDDALAGGDGTNTVVPGAGEDQVFTTERGRTHLHCPTRFMGTPPPSCARIRRGRPPGAWPPSGSASTAGFAHNRAWPRVRRKASWVRVKLPAKKRKRVCVRIYTRGFYGNHFRPYRARAWTKFPYRVRRPRPNRASDTATVRRIHC